MKLMQRFIFFITIIFISPVLAIANSATSINDFKTKDITIDHYYDNADSSARATYPQIISDQSSQNIIKINKLIKNLVTSDINDHISDCAETKHEFYTDKDFRGDRKHFLGGDIDIDSKFYSLNSSIVSLRLEEDRQSPLGANDNPWLSTLNIDTQTGQVIQFSDLFIANSNYFAVINTLAGGQLDPMTNATPLPNGDMPPLTPTLLDKYLAWNLTKTGLVVNDSDWGVQGYGQDYVIPYVKLKNIMKPYWYKRLTN